MSRLLSHRTLISHNWVSGSPPVKAAGHVILSATMDTNVHDSFNFRGVPGGLNWPNPLELGSFVDGYQSRSVARRVQQHDMTMQAYLREELLEGIHCDCINQCLGLLSA